MESKSNSEGQQPGASAPESAGAGSAPGASESQGAAGGPQPAAAVAPPTPPADNATAKKSVKEVEVRVLIDCDHGSCNDVVSLPVKVAAQAVKEGKADDAAEAVAYAKSLATDGEA